MRVKNERRPASTYSEIDNHGAEYWKVLMVDGVDIPISTSSASNGFGFAMIMKDDSE